MTNNAARKKVANNKTARTIRAQRNKVAVQTVQNVSKELPMIMLIEISWIIYVDSLITTIFRLFDVNFLTIHSWRHMNLYEIRLDVMHCVAHNINLVFD